MSSRIGVTVSAEMANTLFRQLEVKSNEATRNFEFHAAKKPENLSLNRWNNVLPFDMTRVVLSPPYQSRFSVDYINASYVSVSEAERCYILTQGPLRETIWHFWTMVFQVNCPAIVMLCRLNESGVCKCEKYWPVSVGQDESIADPASGLEVKLLSEEEVQDIVIRKIDLRHVPSKSSRIITQYHYYKWPDFGVPSEPDTFLRLLEKVSREHPSVKDQPSIVHCSAGIGRSGTFCLADSCIQIMKKRQGPMTRQEILDTLLDMRRCRSGLVQTPEQLRFSLYAIDVAMQNMESRKNGHTENSQEINGVSCIDDSSSHESSDDEKYSEEDFFRKTLQQSNRKRSTTEEDPDMDKEEVLEPTADLVLNGESQPKRSKPDW